MLLRNGGGLDGGGSALSCLWQEGETVALPEVAMDLSNAGHVVGSSGPYSGWIWRAGQILELQPFPGHNWAWPRAVNDRGDAAGITFVNYDTDDFASSSAIWRDGVREILPDVSAYDINFSGAVLLDDSIWLNGNITSLLGGRPAHGGLRPVDSFADEMNDAGHVVGFTSSNAAAIWDGSQWRELNTLLDPHSEFVPYVQLDSALTINNAGQIVAFGTDSRTGRHAYLLTPQSDELELTSVTLKSAEVAGCKSVIGSVAISQPAPVEGVVITLRDTLASSAMPTSIKLPSGSLSKSFTISTFPVSTRELGTVSATLGDVTRAAVLAVRPMGLLSLTLTPTTVVGSNAVTGTAKLECKAGPGPITVDLASSNPAMANPIAASIVVPQATQSTTFAIATNAVQSKSSSIIEATANGTKKSRTLTVAPAASVSPTSLKFGNQTVNTSATLVTTLSNKGAAAFTVNGISLGGTSPQFYKLSNNCPAILSAGASCSISVTFTPTIAAFRSAKLVITTSATSTPLSVLLGGTGVLPPP